MMQAALSRPVTFRPATAAIVAAIAAILGALPLGRIAASAQAPHATPQVLAPQVLAESGRSAAPPASLDALKQREQELETLRAEQKKTLENEARLKREIELIGDDRRKFNQQIIDTASRVVGVEERIAQTQERLRPLDDCGPRWRHAAASLPRCWRRCSASAGRRRKA
jgi:septal ring factor EnvC (AmiA/AmiB activator)